MTPNRGFWIFKARFCLLMAALCVFLLPASLVASASAETAREQLQIEISARPDALVEPSDIMLTFSITNTSAVDALNVYLSSADGLLSEPVGRIAAGETQSFNRQHSVTADELDAGGITYTISHDDPLEPMGKVNYTMSAEIHRSAVLPQVEFTRQFSSRSIVPGDTLIITYRVRNTGNIALNNLRVQDALGDYTGRVDRLEVGESRSLISRATVTEACISSAMLDYYTDGDSETMHTRTLEDAEITLAESGMEASLSAAYSPFRRNTADVMLILRNTGNADIREITITDDIYGGVIADSILLPAGGDPVEINHSYSVRSNAGYRWRITGTSEAGETIELATENVALLPLDEGEITNLTLEAAARTPRIRRSGTVPVEVRISNPGGADIHDIVLSEAEKGDMRKYAILPAGDTIEQAFPFYVTENTGLHFSIRYLAADGAQRSIDCPAVQVTIASDGVMPEDAATGFIEFTGSSIKIGGSTTFAALLIAGCVVLLILVIMLIIANRRARIEKQVRIAAEKRRRKEEMGKNQARNPKNKAKGR